VCVCARACAYMHVCTYMHTYTYYHTPTWKPSNLAVIPSFPASQAHHYCEYGNWHSWGPVLPTLVPPHLWVVTEETWPEIGPLHPRRSIPSTPWVDTTAKLLLPTAWYWRACVMYSIQRHYIRTVSGLQMSRSLEIHSTDSSLYCTIRKTLRSVSGGGTYGLIWTVNYLEPHSLMFLKVKQAVVHLSTTKSTRTSDLGLTLGLSRGVDRGLISTKVPLANIICPQFLPPTPNLITAIKYQSATTDATISSHSDVQFK